MKITRSQLRQIIKETLQEQAVEESPLSKLGKGIRSAGWSVDLKADGLRIQHGSKIEPETYYDGDLKWKDEPN